MTNSIEKLVADLAHQPNAEPLERVIDLAQKDPSSLESLITIALAKAPKGGTFIDLALSHISEEAFKRLVEVVCTSLPTWHSNKVADSIVEYASLQLPHLLHPYLPDIFEYRRT